MDQGKAELNKSKKEKKQRQSIFIRPNDKLADFEK